MEIKNITVKCQASVQNTKTGKLVIRLSLDEFDRDSLVIERGKQPDEMFMVIVN